MVSNNNNNNMPSICPGELNIGVWHIHRSSNQQKKENLQNCGLCWPQSKIERKWKEGWVPGPYLGNWRNYGTWKWRFYQL